MGSPDVLLLDLRMPKKDGLQVITMLLSPAGEPKKIFVAGGRGYLDSVEKPLNLPPLDSGSTFSS
jgi:CheY-like chemotaxis protein